MNIASITPRFLIQLMAPLTLWGAAAVTTEHNDISRTGVNANETILNTSNVNSGTFGKLFSRVVDGQIYAQPLYVPGVTIPGQMVHNVIYVCTEHNSVYAFDADSAGASAPLWQVNLGPSVPSTVLNITQEFVPEIGVTSTPVIDLASSTIYVVAETYENGSVIFRLHALDITSGSPKNNSPVAIEGNVPGNGADSRNHLIAFNPFSQLQRPGLLLLNDTIYIGFGGHESSPVFHGWVFAYNGTTLQRSAIFCTSPNSDSSGVWQAGAGLAADSNGNIYFASGNGSMDANTGGGDYGDSILRLGANLTVLDYFSPSNQANLSSNGADLGSGGVVLLPGTSLGIGGGKDGRVFLFNINNLGQFKSTDSVVQEWQATTSIYAGTVYYNSSLYLWGHGSSLEVFSFNGSTFNTTPSSTSTNTIPLAETNQPAMSVSANGATSATGILWSSYGSSVANGAPFPGILRALDASDVSRELWNSNQNSARDYTGTWAKFSPPTVANGKVYLASADRVLNVYGLFSTTTANGVLTGVADNFTSAVNLTTEGTADWVHWGDGSLNRKAEVPQISDFQVVGSASSATYANDPRLVNWIDGAPTTSSASNQNGVSIAGVQNGFLFTAPADTIVRKVAVHVGGFSSGGTLTAHLSDGSAGDFVDVTAVADGWYDRNYTLTYSAGSAGKILTVTWLMNSGGGNVTLSAAALASGASGTALLSRMSSAALASGAANVQASGGTPQNATVDASFATALQATVTDASSQPVSGVTVTFTAPGTPIVPTTLNASYFAMATNDPDAGFANDEGNAGHSFVTTVGAGLGSHGLPVLNATGQSILQDFDPTTKELRWWSTLNPNVSVLNNNVYPSAITLPFSNTHMYTNATVLGQNGNDTNAFLTAIFVGNLSVTSPGTVSFNLCSNDDALLYLSGGAFGANGTLVSDNGGIHDKLCTNGNVNTNLLNNVAAGNYTLTVFYDDRQQVGAEFDLSVSLPGTAPLDPSGTFNSGTVATALTNTAGQATAPTFTANALAGSYAVTATVAGVATPANFNLTNNPGTPAYVKTNGGTPQSAAINTQFATPLQATVQDSEGNPIGGVPITFTAPSSGPGGLFNGSLTAIVPSTSSGIAVAPALTANSQLGCFAVTAGAAGAGAPALFSLKNTGSGGGSGSCLLGAGSSSVAPVNLTVEGTLDWVHWGDGVLNRKAGATPNLSSYTLVGSGSVLVYSNDPRPVNWTDGAPAINGTNNMNGVYVNGAGQGFSFTAPADTTARTLIVHVGGWNSGATLTAHLSDGSAPDFTDVTGTVGGQYDRNYTLVYSAASAARTLTVTWKMTSGSGNVTLNAAALVGGNVLMASAGTPQSTAVNTVFAAALQATVKDGTGNPVSGVTVTFAAPTSGASATFSGSASVTTNSSGIATAPALTANNLLGNYTMTAGILGAAPVTFNLTNTVGPPATIVATGGTPQSAPVNTVFGTALQATVKDSGGNPVSGVMVTFKTPTSGQSGTFGGSPSVTTNSSGIATAPTLTANSQAGAYTVTATVGGVGTAASFSLSNSAGAPTTIVASSGTPQSAAVTTAFAAQLQALVKDVGGNPVSGAIVTFAVPSSGASATFNSSSSVSTNSSGIATSPMLTANSLAGGYTITATVTGVGTPANFSLTNTGTVGPGALQGVESTSAAAVNLTAEGSLDWEHWGDESLNRKAGVIPQLSSYTQVGAGPVVTYNNDPRPISWSDGAPAASSTNNTFGIYINGIGQGFSFTASADATTRTLLVHLGGYSSGGTLTAHLSDGSAPDFIDVNGITGGSYDRNYTLTYSAASAGQTLTITWKMTSGGGNVTLNAAALQGAGSIAASAGTPQSAAVGSVFGTALKATVTDSGGNPVNGATVTFTAPSSGATATFSGSASVTTNASGVATAPALTANSQLGSYTVMAAVAGVGSANFSLTNTAGPPASVVTNAGTPQSTSVNTAFATALQALVKDSGGNPVSGVMVTFTAPGGTTASFGASATAAASTNASGVATAPTLTAGSLVGPCTVTATVVGIATPANFSLTNITGSTASIATNAGTPQSTGVNTAFTTALQALVKDSGGNAVSGALVTFTTPGGATALFGVSATASASTNAIGIATAPTLTAGSAAGGYTVTATVTGVATAANFSLTNTGTGAASGGSLAGTGTSATTAVNLTTEGSVDWVHWGENSLNRKAGVTPLLSTYTIVGTGSVLTYNNDPRLLSWTDGAPTASSSNNRNGAYIRNVGQGFSFTAPADPTLRSLVVHVGGWSSGGTLTAHLSDGSAADFTDVSGMVSGQYDRNYSLTYNAASAGQTLTVTWKMTSGNGNVALNALTLH